MTGAALALRRRARRVGSPKGRVVMDTCGTGGDGKGTFNVSTAVAFVVAAAGVVVAKHGNARVSSRCGSADVLSAAGVSLDASVPCLEQCLDELGVAFLLAPMFHPVMKEVASVRRELGVRTLFNILGPLANPAQAPRQLLGVYHARLVPLVAGALAALGTERSLVVHGADGLDEVSPAGPTHAVLVEGARLTELTIHPEDAGIRRQAPGETTTLQGGDPAHNASVLREVLTGRGPAAVRDAVVLNAAAALWVAGVSEDLRECGDRARGILGQGSAAAKLEALVRMTRGEGARQDAGARGGAGAGREVMP